MAKTTMIKVGVWEVVNVGKKYRYWVLNVGGPNQPWTVHRTRRGSALGNPEDALKFIEKVEGEFHSRASAVEYVEELAPADDFNPVADLLDNIDDGIDLDN